MKLIFPVTVLMLVLISIRINSQTVAHNDIDYIESYDNAPYLSPTPGEIPIVASSPWVWGKVPAANDLEGIKECGFNCVLSFATVSYFKKVEPLLERTGLKAIMGFPEFDSDSGIRIIDSLKRNPVIGGWRVTDEPNEKDFSMIYKRYAQIEKADPDHMAYINLVGPGNKSFYGDCPDYYSFIMEFQEVFHPAVLSYDLYPVSIKDRKVKVDYARFYEAFETYSKISAMIGRPFWAYSQTMAFSNSFVERPAANLAYLSFEAFSALGYGAKGLVYWTYCLRESNENEKFYSALVDLNFKKSDAWYAARQVNMEIKTLKEVFLNTTYEETWHTGLTIPDGCRRYKPYTECLAKVKGGKEGFQISKLSAGSMNYLVIVNKDVEKSQKISLTIDKRYEVVNIQVVETATEYDVSEKKIKNSYKATIDPGRYMILRYNK